MRHLVLSLVLASVVVVPHALAQGTPPAPLFKVGYTDIGPTVGLGSIGGAGVAIGGRLERAIRKLPDLGDGVLAIQASVDSWSYGDRFGALDYDFRYIAFGGTGNYHFRVKSNPKVDPFVGLGLGFSTVSTDFTGDFSSGLYLISRAGIRYFYKPRMAFYADAGVGAASLNVGLTFALGAGK